MLRNILALFGFVSVTLVSVVAINAQDWNRGDDRPPSLHVGFADLDLSHPDGQRRLDRRIRGAIDRICGSREYGDLSARRLVDECRRAARRSTETQVARAVDRARTRDVAAVGSDTPPPPVAGGTQ